MSRVVLDAAGLDTVVRRLGAELSAAYPNGVVLVAVLKGSVVFLSDLVRAMSIDPVIDFLAVTSYAPGSGRVRLVKDLDTDIAGRDVVVVEDVIDTGLTLTYLLGELRGRRPASLEVCALVDKRVRRIAPVDARFIGIAVDDEFLVGYGLDIAGRYRNLSVLAAAPFDTVKADPDALVEELYGWVEPERTGGRGRG